jgi:hypothetical protein
MPRTSGAVNKALLLVKPAIRIFPEESVSIDIYLTSRELPLDPTG